eukprot:3023847-Prymnesium_polylepis.3
MCFKSSTLRTRANHSFGRIVAWHRGRSGAALGRGAVSVLEEDAQIGDHLEQPLLDHSHLILAAAPLKSRNTTQRVRARPFARFCGPSAHHMGQE